MVQKPLIDFYTLVLSDMHLEVMKVQVKQEANQSIDQHLVVCPLWLKNHIGPMWLAGSNAGVCGQRCEVTVASKSSGF